MVTAPAHSASPAGRFAVEDIGKATCATFTAAQAQKGAAFERLMGYVEGYMSAANRYEPNTFDLSPWHNRQAFALLIGTYCRGHAGQPVTLALEKLVSALRPIRLVDDSPMVAVSDAGHSIRVYAAILKRAQGELARQHLYTGPQDGRDSPSLRAALTQFQANAKLRPSGLPDPATLWMLLNP